jgi:uncharacterized membrane-anchored protein YitT (DUF2179 family)
MKGVHVRMRQNIIRKTKKSRTGLLKNYVVITAAAFTYAVGVSLFIDPNNMAPGGVTGIAIMLNRLTPVTTGTWIFLLNIPILIFAVWRFGIGFTVSSVYGIFLISIFTNILSRYDALTHDTLLAALAGGVLSAASIGIIFRAGATTGGMDIIVKAIRMKLPHLRTGKIYLIADTAVVALSGFLFHNVDAALYAAISVVCASATMDVVLYGRDEARLLYIISSRPEQIAERILADLEIGLTYIGGRGAYSGKDKKVILCAMKKTVSPHVEEIVKEEDPDAFMIITSATEIFGEGYKSYYSETL